MKVNSTPLSGLLEITPRVFRDKRGLFCETYQRERYVEAGIVDDFVQDNHSYSRGGILRGLHFTIASPQAQLIYVSSGEIYDVAVDLRAQSPTFGHWHGIYLNGDTHRQRYLPAGFAHGFCVTGDHADVHYKITHVYDQNDEGGINWCDKTLNIRWPIKNPIVSDRDAGFPFLSEMPEHQLPGVSFFDEPISG